MLPAQIPNLIDNVEAPAAAGQWLPKLNPHDGSLLTRAARSQAADIDRAVQAARRA